ncbi:hypothetical protein H8R23_05005 [Flavobacterium sp. F-380]|uniref:Terminase small subunit n=1 Tax=Flavobacterium kayseriense TaxID=2764714 RepID=A0ABR7J5P4_9FLAO|nr:hypothetical protein [Flavobacterium kayseriense]MBC5840756.1 hypothetical protein [Flavobacterium kayseriense]MBC5846574.1 hypothetical protein [Flavobacterium kayseriense]
MSSNAVILRKKVSTLDKIRKYYLKGEDSVKLSDKQDEIRIRVLKAWNLMINYLSKEQAMAVIMNEYGCSRAQSYRYVSDAMSVFGNPVANQKEAEKYLLGEELIRSQQRSIKNKDEAAYLKAAALRIKLGGFDKDTLQNFDPEKLKAQTYVLKVHPSVLKTIEANEDGGSIDFNNLDTEDVDFQEVKEDDDEE